MQIASSLQLNFRCDVISNLNIILMDICTCGGGGRKLKFTKKPGWVKKIGRCPRVGDLVSRAKIQIASSLQLNFRCDVISKLNIIIMDIYT
jgi:hypothetical protein